MHEINTHTAWLTEREVAEITKISVSSLQKWRHFRRGFKYSKIGRSVRYSEAEVLSYMAARQIEFSR